MAPEEQIAVFSEVFFFSLSAHAAKYELSPPGHNDEFITATIYIINKGRHAIVHGKKTFPANLVYPINMLCEP